MTIRKRVTPRGLLFSCSVSHKLDDKHKNREVKDKLFWSVWKFETFCYALEIQFDLIHHFQRAEVTDLLAVRYWNSRNGVMKIKQEILA